MKSTIYNKLTLYRIDMEGVEHNENIISEDIGNSNTNQENV